VSRTFRPKFFLAAIGAVVAASLLSACSGGSYKLIATFDDVGDLQPRGSVQVADVRVGQIGSIRLTSDFRARVVLHVKSDVKIPADATALLRTTSLLGEKFVELRPATAESYKTGPFLHDGERVQATKEAPELETVADSAIQLLGSIDATDIATLTNESAAAFGPHSADLRSLITNLATVSASLADRTRQIGDIVDHLDKAAVTLASGADDLRDLFSNLSRTTQILSDNRDKLVTTLADLSRLARAQDAILDPYFANINLQIQQVGRIVATVRQSQSSLDALLVWLDHFTTEVPELIPADFAQIYMRVAPAATDPRAGG